MEHRKEHAMGHLSRWLRDKTRALPAHWLHRRLVVPQFKRRGLIYGSFASTRVSATLVSV